MNAIIKNDAASEGDHQKTVQEHSSGGAGDVVVLTVLDAHHYEPYKRQGLITNRASRIASVVLGLGTLVVIGVGLFIFLDAPFKKQSSSSVGEQQQSQNLVATAQLAAHSSIDDCWLTIYGSVYDLTDYARRHPGGEGWIFDHCGDVSGEATTNYKRFHPEALLKSIPETYVGTFVGDALASTSPANNPSSPEVAPGPSPTDSPQAKPSSCISSLSVAAHNSQADCHTIYYGQVYDMTSYANRHPGGQGYIIDWCGLDGTSAFSGIRNHNTALLDKFVSQSLIGSIC